jgi:hypothetical protein
MSTGPEGVGEVGSSRHWAIAVVNPHEFSSEALMLFESSLIEYRESLLKVARRVARGEQADTISAIHVREAGRLLVRRPESRWYAALSGVGVFCVGSAAREFISAVSGGAYTETGILVAVALAAVGAFCLLASWWKKL